MKEKDIKRPDSTKIKQFFVDGYENLASLDNVTKNEFYNILKAIEPIYSIYKNIEEKIVDSKVEPLPYINNCEFLKIEIKKIIILTDFVNQIINPEPLKLPPDIYPISENIVDKTPCDLVIRKEKSKNSRSKF